jgi:hypothetical protein
VTAFAEGVMLAAGGFLLAVLWMDLIFDSQVGHVPAGALPDAVLASVAGYYRRATTTSRPMSRLIAAVMVLLVVAVVFRAVCGPDPGWLTAVSAVLAAVPIGLAAARTVPNAVRLGGRGDVTAEQSRLARSVYRDHIVCFVLLTGFVFVRLAAVW